MNLKLHVLFLAFALMAFTGYLLWIILWAPMIWFLSNSSGDGCILGNEVSINAINNVTTESHILAMFQNDDIPFNFYVDDVSVIPIIQNLSGLKYSEISDKENDVGLGDNLNSLSITNKFIVDCFSNLNPTPFYGEYSRVCTWMPYLYLQNNFYVLCYYNNLGQVTVLSDLIDPKKNCGVKLNSIINNSFLEGVNFYLCSKSYFRSNSFSVILLMITILFAGPNISRNLEWLADFKFCQNMRKSCNLKDELESDIPLME